MIGVQIEVLSFRIENSRSRVEVVKLDESRRWGRGRRSGGGPSDVRGKSSFIEQWITIFSFLLEFSNFAENS